MGQKANFVKFICFVKYFCNVFAAHSNLRKSVFKIDMPPSFLLWRITISSTDVFNLPNYCEQYLDSNFSEYIIIYAGFAFFWDCTMQIVRMC